MRFKFAKDLHILNDLLAHCHRLGGRDFQIEMHTSPEVAVIEIRCHLDKLSAEALAHLTKSLSVPRQHEVEQNYWGLSTDFESRPELMLTGMMVDTCDVRYTEDILYIAIGRSEV